MNFIMGLIGLVLAVATIMWLIYFRGEFENDRKLVRVGILLGVLGVLLLVFSMSFKIIETGHTGIKVTLGQISEDVLRPGFNWKIPLAEKIIDVNNKKQDITLAKEQIEGASSEKVKVYIKNATVTYRIAEDKSSHIYKNVANYSDGNSLFDSVLVDSAIKATTVKFSVINLADRNKLEPEMKIAIQAALDEKYGAGAIIIDKVSVGNIDQDETYSQMIQERNNAQELQKKQEIENKTAAEKAENENKMAKEKAANDNEIKLNKAKTNAETLKIAAEAEKLANELRTESLTQEVLIKYWLDKWDGKLPTVMDGDGNVMLDIDKLMSDTGK